MLEKLDDIAATFQSVDEEMRLELLLDFANRMPPLPPRMQARRDAGINRVHECLTPVFLFMEAGDAPGSVRMYVDVAPESPTVRGLVSILAQCCDGQPAAEVMQLPDDLLGRLGLHQCIGAQRTMGFAGILARIKRAAAQFATAAVTA
jgi:cysteine desulfuration protein SufE